MSITIPETRNGTVFLFYEARCGCDIKEALSEAWLVSLKTSLPVRIDFNDVKMTITEHLPPTQAYAVWSSLMHKDAK
jgi:hypothetical protein